MVHGAQEHEETAELENNGLVQKWKYQIPKLIGWQAQFKTRKGKRYPKFMKHWSPNQAEWSQNQETD